MRTYVLVDFANMFFRSKHHAGKGATLDEKNWSFNSYSFKLC